MAIWGGHDNVGGSNRSTSTIYDHRVGKPSSIIIMSDDLSIDSDVAFAFVDFSEVDFGDDNIDKKNTDNVIGDQVVEKLQAGIQEPEVDREYHNKLLNTAQAEKLQVTFPGGQQPEADDHEHDSELFQLQCLRVENLVKWHELGVRPKRDKTNLAAHNQDEDLFQTSTDDLKQLLFRSIEAQDEVNKNLPPHPVADYENDLKVATSSIENAGNGLFTTVFIPKGAVVCHYTGYRHHYQSQKRLQNREYVLKLQNGWPKHDRRNDGFVDAFPCKSVLARFINDPRMEEKCNVKFEHIKEPGIWHCPVIAQRDIDAGEELFISYGPRYWEQSRMIGG